MKTDKFGILLIIIIVLLIFALAMAARAQRAATAADELHLSGNIYPSNRIR